MEQTITGDSDVLRLLICPVTDSLFANAEHRLSLGEIWGVINFAYPIIPSALAEGESGCGSVCHYIAPNGFESRTEGECIIYISNYLVRDNHSNSEFVRYSLQRPQKPVDAKSTILVLQEALFTVVSTYCASFICLAASSPRPL